MSPIAKVLFLCCDSSFSTVSLAEVQWHLRLPAHRIIQEANGRGLTVVP